MAAPTHPILLAHTATRVGDPTATPPQGSVLTTHARAPPKRCSQHHPSLLLHPQGSPPPCPRCQLFPSHGDRTHSSIRSHAMPHGPTGLFPQLWHPALQTWQWLVRSLSPTAGKNPK